MNLDKWDHRWLKMAEMVSTWSKDPSTGVGCVIARGKRIVSLGYNGFPEFMRDDENLLNDRDEKISRIIHAEMNAIKGIDVLGATAYIFPVLSCSRCCVHLINAGIVEVVTYKPSPEFAERWGADFEKTRKYYAECSVILKELDREALD